jgi:hypothetical protein
MGIKMYIIIPITLIDQSADELNKVNKTMNYQFITWNQSFQNIHELVLIQIEQRKQSTDMIMSSLLCYVHLRHPTVGQLLVPLSTTLMGCFGSGHEDIHNHIVS